MANSWQEEKIGQQYDRCIAIGIIKIGAGGLLGGLASLMFFRGRKWPIIGGVAFGISEALHTCQLGINDSLKPSKQYSKS